MFIQLALSIFNVTQLIQNKLADFSLIYQTFDDIWFYDRIDNFVHKDKIVRK